MSLYVESEVHDVSVLHYIFLAFHTQFSGFAHGGFTAVFDVVFVLDDFRADKTFLKVGVDNAGRIAGLSSLCDRSMLLLPFRRR